jgi:hypothetical protein
MDTVMIRSGKVAVLLGTPLLDSANKIIGYTGVTSNQSSTSDYKDSPWSTYQATVTGTGAVTATIAIYGSNDGVNFNTTALGTITLSGTNSATDGFAYVGPWKYVKATLTNLTGTGAACYVLQGV